jgi:hypothetical protein
MTRLRGYVNSQMRSRISFGRSRKRGNVPAIFGVGMVIPLTESWSIERFVYLNKLGDCNKFLGEPLPWCHVQERKGPIFDGLRGRTR